MEEENNKRKKLKKLLLILLLIIIIILLCYLLYQHFFHDEDVSSGNLQKENIVENVTTSQINNQTNNEINDITNRQINNQISYETNNGISGRNTIVSEQIIDAGNPDEDKSEDKNEVEEPPIVNEFTIESEDFKWGEKTSIKVFENVKLNVATNVIWPGAEGEYHFSVSNTLQNGVIYKISFEERNTSNINMHYKVVKDGEQINSEWSRIADIDIQEKNLNSNEKHNYILKWKWIEQTEEEDMQKMGKAYGLDINIFTESR